MQIILENSWVYHSARPGGDVLPGSCQLGSVKENGIAILNVLPKTRQKGKESPLGRNNISDYSSVEYDNVINARNYFAEIIHICKLPTEVFHLDNLMLPNIADGINFTL